MKPMKRRIKVGLRLMAGGLVLLVAGHVAMAINQPPGCQSVTIVTNPVSQIKCLGSSASFSVVATGSGPLLYQWQRNHVNLSDGGSVSGSTTPTLLLTGLVAGDSHSGYRVMVSNVCDGVSSGKIGNSATLTVTTSYSLTAAIAGPGETCFQSTNTYTSGAASGNSWSISGQGTIVGAANGQTVSVASRASGSYTLALTVISGSCTDSTTETVTIIPAWAAIYGPSEVCSLTQNIYAGPEAPDLDYNWSISGQGTIIGATSDQSIFVLAGMNGSYTLSLTVSEDGGCSSTASNTVSIYNSAVIVTQPVSQVACAGGTVTFSVGAVGSSLSYQWQKNGVNLTDDVNMSGASTAILTINNIGSLGSGNGPSVNNTVPAGSSIGVNFGSVIAGRTYAYQASGCVAGARNATVWGDPGGNWYYLVNSSCALFQGKWVGGRGFTCPGFFAGSLVGKVGGYCVQLGTNGTFVAPASGTLTLYFNDDNYSDNSGSWNVIITPVDMGDTYDVVVTDSCNSQSSVPVTLTLASPAALVSGSATNCSSQSTQIRAALTGTPPWSVTWSDGVTQSNIMASPVMRSVSPTTTTSYTITNVADAYCTNSASGSAVITVISSGNTVATPTFSPEGRAYLTSLSVTVSCATVGASIHYTTNGLMPTLDDPAIASGSTIALSQTVILQARAFTNGYCGSAVKGGLYQIGPMVAAGGWNGFFVQTNGVAWGWGDNSQDGILGRDSISLSGLTPVVVRSNISALAACQGHTVAIDNTNAAVWYWGDDSAADGNYGTNATFAPTPVDSLSNVNVASVAGTSFSGFYDDYSLVVKSDGTVWAWGDDTVDELGLGLNCSFGSCYSNSPAQTVGLSSITEVGASRWGVSIALRSDGAVWAWGMYSNRFFDPNAAWGSGGCTGTPIQVIGLSNIVAIAVGSQHAVALNQDGTVWTWGWDSQGQLGTGDPFVNNSHGYAPAQVPGLSNVVSIAAGDSHSVAVTASGQVYTWGANAEYDPATDSYDIYVILGTGSTSNYVSTPQLVSGLGTVQSVNASGNQTLAVGNYRGVYVVWAWGDNTYSQLGNGTTSNAATPILVALPIDTDGDGMFDWQKYQLGVNPLNLYQNGDGS
jgi:alpha-tubulin suppressor-like RCC1 family protein